MLSGKAYKDYPALRGVVEELDERFIIGLDPKVLTDSKLIFFKIQKAFWYYKDHFERLIKERKIPSMPLELFGQLLIEESQILSRIYPHSDRESNFRDWQEYLRRVPRLGAICLNPAADKVLMIQPYGRNRKCLQFPRGKLHAGEDHARAAAREVWEECGIRIENLMDPDVWFEALIDQTLHKLYVVFPVMEELVPSIQCNKEIEKIVWVPLSDLPGWASKASYDDKGFFGVAPFVSELKAFVKHVKPPQKSIPTVRILKRPTLPPPDDIIEGKDENDLAADTHNEDTFGESTGWSFNEMLSANTKLGVVSSSLDQNEFDKAYSVQLRGNTSTNIRLVEAFRTGWFS